MTKILAFFVAVLSCFLVINAEYYSKSYSYERDLQGLDNITSQPTDNPTASPTTSPTKSPTKSPTAAPTDGPTASPTRSPTTSPTKSPTKSPTRSPTQNPTGNPTTNPTRSPIEFPPESEGVDIAVIGGAIGGVFCLFVLLGGFFIFILLGRRSNRVRTGKKPVDENLIRSMAVLDEKKREVEESRRIQKEGKARRKASLELDQEAQITDLRGDSVDKPPAPASVISTASSQPPPGLNSSVKSVGSTGSQPPPGIYNPTAQPAPTPRLSEVSVGSKLKLSPPGENRSSQISVSSSQAGIPRLSSGNVNALPRVMSKSLEKQKVTAQLKEKQGSEDAEKTDNIEKKPSILD